MFKFYEITFTNKNGNERYVPVVGSEQQVNDYAINEASKRGEVYEIIYQATGRYSHSSCIVNLTNT